jgi:DNA-binding response OmpR family regulator
MNEEKTLRRPKGDILIVDDNPINLKLLANMLSEQQYKVRVTTSGPRAIDAVSVEPPDLIMLDINMPEMDGYEVCRRFKTNNLTNRIPIIFISALDEAMDKVKAFSVGGVDYVTKPFQVEEVLARIDNQLSLARLRKELERQNAELEKKNAELIRKQDELIKTYQQADSIFAALSNFLPGTIFDEKYSLECKIGEGGFGTIYRATHIDLNRVVAIKIFRPIAGRFTKEEMDQFRQEGMTTSKLTHPNIVTVFDFSVSKIGVPYMVMELLEGHSLQEEIYAKGVLSPARCAEILIPICEVLGQAHASGIIHRDIKPNNIFLHQGQDGEVVKLLDFGIAKLLSDSPNNQHFTHDCIFGTPAFIAPERWSNEPYSGKADVYSLGITLYAMLCGMLPFNPAGDTFPAIVTMHLNHEPAPLKVINPEIPSEIEAVVLKALLKDPQKRPTARELGWEFINALNE